MNIIVIGLGSMGKRRIRLLKQINDDINIFGVDTNIERLRKVEKDFQIKGYESIEEALKNEKVDAAVISTSPLSHNKIIKECLDNDLHIFTELNLVNDGYSDNIKLAKDKNKVLFLSSTFLYRKEIEYINNRVKASSLPVNYSYHVGQFLPDWHPWESFKDFFVNDARTNGCRELFAVELPWIVNVFGDVESIKVIKDKMSNIEVSYPDNFLVLLQHKNGNKGMLAIDIVSRKAVRNLEIFGEELHLNWQGRPESLTDYDIEKKEDVKVEMYETVDKLAEYSSNIIEDAYKEELLEYISAIKDGVQPRYSFEKDESILELIDLIEE